MKGLPCEGQLKPAISKEPEGERRFSRSGYRGRGEEGDFTINIFIIPEQCLHEISFGFELRNTFKV